MTPTVAPLRVLVIDDERPARAQVLRMIGGDARFAVVGEARDGIEALEQIEALSPELLILDIQMPGLDGFELLDALNGREDFSVLFSTASDAHALRAFEAAAVDYLLKPYQRARFQRALDKAYLQRLGRAAGPAHAALLRTALGSERARLALKTCAGPWVRVLTDDIVRISSEDKYACVVTRVGQHIVRRPLRALAEQLDARFVRVHRGDIINVQAVVRVEPWDHGDALLIMDDGSSVVLTRRYRQAFFARFSAP